MHRGYLGRVLVVLLDYGAARQVRHRYDVVGVVHAVLLDAVDVGVDVASGTVEVGGVHVDDQGLAGDVLGVDACRVGEPVVAVDDVEGDCAGYDPGHDGVVVDLLEEVVGVAAGELDAPQVVEALVVEVGVDVRAQVEV